MADVRYALRNGDGTSTGGVVIGTGEMLHHDVRVAVEGDLATCPACKKAGPVFNDCCPSFVLMGKRILVEGARVYCGCETKPLVMASQSNFTIEVNTEGTPAAESRKDGRTAPEAFNKMTEDEPHDRQKSQTMRICPNMSNDVFFETMDGLRDKAVRLLGDRLGELERWDRADRDKVALWFGSALPETRIALHDGLIRIREIMRGLTAKNYERSTPEGLARVGCVPRAGAGEIPASASVCKPDGTYTIFIGDIFCQQPDEDNRYDGVPLAKDSKLVTLIHEVSHFQVAMDTEDHWYSLKRSQDRAADRDAFCLSNADNIAGYVANIPNWNGKKPVWSPQ
ncbi:PAAR domain-containing protein [Cupriavidus pinatubonensis]|uniref:PAAR domain-containing protein n=1 Tax=Cupriavidus pinatubonensis TaxID=248026 RepID=UPI003616B058